MKEFNIIYAGIFLVLFLMPFVFSDAPGAPAITESILNEQQRLATEAAAIEAQVMQNMPSNLGDYDFEYENGDFLYSGQNLGEFSDIGDAISFALSDSPQLTQEFVDSVNKFASSSGGSNISKDMTPSQVKTAQKQMSQLLEKKLDEKSKKIYDNLKKLKESFKSGNDNSKKKISFQALVSGGIFSSKLTTKISNEDGTMEISLGSDYDFSKKIIFSDNNGVKTIIVEGKAEYIKLPSTQFNNVEKAKFIFDKDGNMKYVKFKATKLGQYKFLYGSGKTFMLTAKEGSEFEFDLDKKTVTGTNMDFVGFKEGSIIGVTSFSLALNDNKEVISVFVDRGIFYTSKGEMVKSSTGGSFEVFLDGRDIKGMSGKNAVSFGNDKVRILGKIDIQSLKGNVGSFLYSGLSDDAYTEFEIDKNFFNSIEGDCSFSNSQMEVLIKDREASVKKLSNNPIDNENFGFSHMNNNNEKIEGYFNVNNGEYVFNVFKENGEKVTIVTPFSKIENIFQTTSQLFLSDRNVRIANLNEEIKDLESRIETASSVAEKENLQFQKMQKENEVLGLRGERIDSLIEKTTSFRDSITDLSVKAKIDNEIAILRNLKINGIDVPRLWSIDNPKGLNDFEGREKHESQKIEFEVYSDGKVSAYYFEGRRIEINGEQTEIAPGLSDGNLATLENLINNGATLQNLETDNKDTLKLEGFSVDAPQSQEAIINSRQLREQLSEAIRFAQESGDKKLEAELRIQEARSYTASRIEMQEGLNSLRDIAATSDFPDDLRAEALASAALSLYQTDPSSNTGIAHRYFDEALQIDPNNKRILEMQKSFNTDSLQRYQSMALGTITKFNARTGEMLGEGDGAWRTTKDVLSAVFLPGEMAYVGTLKGMEILEQQKATYTDVERSVLAGYQLAKLNENGFNPKDYSRATFLQRFGEIYRANGFADTLSISQLEGFIREAGGIFNPEGTYTGANFDRVVELIREQHGDATAKAFSRNALSTLSYLAIIDEASVRDPSIFRMTHGYEQDEKYLGADKISLDKAFSEYDVGKIPGYSTSERLVMAAGNAALSPLTYIGIGSVIGMAGRTGSVGVQVGAEVLSEGLSMVDPGLGLLGGLAGGLDNFFTSRGVRAEIREVIDSTGKRSFFARIDDAPRHIEDYARGIGAEVVDSNTLRLKDGSIVHYGSEIPSSYRTVDLESVELTSDVVANNHRRVASIVDENAGRRSVETSGCFLAGTKIMLSNGNYKNIEDIKQGDNVKAFDLVNNKVVEADVTTTFVRKANSYRIIEYEIMDGLMVLIRTIWFQKDLYSIY